MSRQDPLYKYFQYMNILLAKLRMYQSLSYINILIRLERDSPWACRRVSFTRPESSLFKPNASSENTFLINICGIVGPIGNTWGGPIWELYTTINLFSTTYSLYAIRAIWHLIFRHTRGYQKVLNLTEKKQDIWIYTAYFST